MDSTAPASSSSNKLPPSSHRLPTVSASQALQELRHKGPQSVSSGLTLLDAILGGPRHGPSSHGGANTVGGFPKGQVTEIWGPPGAGKTALAMQAAAGVMKAGDKVLWIDTASAFAEPRLEAILSAFGGSDDDDTRNCLKNLNKFFTPTVAHLLALVMHSPTSFPPAKTALMVIDGLQTIIDVAYPRYQPSTSAKNEAAKWARGRRYSVLGSLMSAFKKLAAVHNMAVIVTTGCATRIRSGTGYGACLVPGLSGAEWEGGSACKLVVFRDFKPSSDAASQQKKNSAGKSARYVGLQKLQGSTYGDDGEIGQIMAFRIDKGGVRDEVNVSAGGDTVTVSVSSPVKGRKRSHGEVADSDEEHIGDEYGWLDDDEVAAEGLVDEEITLVEGKNPSDDILLLKEQKVAPSV